MDDRGATGTTSTVKRWTSLFEEQTALFQHTIDENEQLRCRVTELERELGVWKLAMKTTDEDNASLKTTNAQLEQILGAVANDNPLLLCLIDGDGHIFQKELLMQGRMGGRSAAMLLTKGLTDYTRTFDSQLSNRARVWLTVFCNKTGLEEVLINQDVCTRDQFQDFCFGFNQAAPLFSIVDCGQGKEAADAKIREYLRVFTRFPQTPVVFFGGAHDNGYTTALTSLENEGFLHKLVLLRGYKDVAIELRNLQLPQLTIDGVFMPHKIPSHLHQRVRGHYQETASTSVPASPQKSSNYYLSSNFGGDEVRHPDPGIALNKHTPPPCTFYYLTACKQGTKCTFGHNYILSPANLIELREYAAKMPCSFVNRNKICPSGDNCISGHICPRGENCSYHKRKTCKFVGMSMHTAPAVVPGAFSGSYTSDEENYQY